jgi:hypothetical protein
MLVLQRSACLCGPSRSGRNRLIDVGSEGLRKSALHCRAATPLPSVVTNQPQRRVIHANSLRRGVFRIPPRIDVGLDIQARLISATMHQKPLSYTICSPKSRRRHQHWNWICIKNAGIARVRARARACVRVRVRACGRSSVGSTSIKAEAAEHNLRKIGAVGAGGSSARV